MELGVASRSGHKHCIRKRSITQVNILEMTREDFQKVPFRKSFCSELPPFESLVIIPTDREHDSGYACMEFVGVNKDWEPVVRMSGCSDVVHIDGIGGYGQLWRQGKFPLALTRPIQAWSIDCLPKSGYLRIFCDGQIIVGDDLSSFEIFWKGREIEK